MAEIQPLKAWRYHPKFNDQIADLTSPLFDVVNSSQRELLYANPVNSIHLSVPKGDNPARSSKQLLSQWKLDQNIIQDNLPSIYVHYQYFSWPGSEKVFCRKGFIANTRIYRWDQEVILRHENTMPHSVKDRKTILDATQLNVSPTHGVYTDDKFILEALLDECMISPVYDMKDYQGVRHVFGIIQDHNAISQICHGLKNKKIILADGHHRYGGALNYLEEKIKYNKNHSGNEGYNYHMMYFTNSESEDLKIFPTHRLLSDLGEFRSAEFIAALEENFDVQEIVERESVNEIILGEKWSFGIMMGDKTFRIRLKPAKVNEMPRSFSKEIRELDLTILHFFIIQEALGINYDDQPKSRNITYERNFATCLTKVKEGTVQIAIITNGIPMDQVKSVCYSGQILPQKSTYFYPKIISGFLFGSIKDGEFDAPIHSSFK